MKKSTMYVGLDVHKNSIKIAIAESGVLNRYSSDREHSPQLKLDHCKNGIRGPYLTCVQFSASATSLCRVLEGNGKYPEFTQKSPTARRGLWGRVWLGGKT